MPDVPPGNLRTLVEALHEIHARAGWPGTRQLSKGRDFSHTAVHDLFTKTTTAAPRPTVLLDVVERLASISRRLEVDETIDRFDLLWEAAHAAPFASVAATPSTEVGEDEETTEGLPTRSELGFADRPPAEKSTTSGLPEDEIRVGTVSAELLAQMTEGKSEAEGATAIGIPHWMVEEIVHKQVLPLYKVDSLEEVVAERRRRGIREVSTVRMIDLIAEGKTEAEAARILDYPPGVFEQRHRDLLEMYDVDSLEKVVEEDRRLRQRQDARPGTTISPPAAAKGRGPGNPVTLPLGEATLLELVADGQPWEEIVSDRLGGEKRAQALMKLVIERLNADSPEAAAYTAWKRGLIRVRPVGYDDDEPFDDLRWGAKEYVVLASDLKALLAHVQAIERRAFKLAGPPSERSGYWVARIRGTGDTIQDRNYLGGYVSTHHGALLGDLADFRETVPSDDEFVQVQALTDRERDALGVLISDTSILKDRSAVASKLSAAGAHEPVVLLYGKLGVYNTFDLVNRATALGLIDLPRTQASAGDEELTEAADITVAREPSTWDSDHFGTPTVTVVAPDKPTQARLELTGIEQRVLELLAEDHKIWSIPELAGVTHPEAAEITDSLWEKLGVAEDESFSVRQEQGIAKARELGLLPPSDDFNERQKQGETVGSARRSDPAGQAFTTELFFFADDVESLHDVAAELRRAGFLVREQPRHVDGTWSLMAYSAATLLDEQDRQVLYDIAERCGAEFDGTGTYVGPPEYDDGPGKPASVQRVASDDDGAQAGPLFEVGEILTTPEAMNRLHELGIGRNEFIERHTSGDWGEAPASSVRTNDRAVRTGDGQVWSTYGRGDERIMVITEADRSSTTVLCPEDL